MPNGSPRAAGQADRPPGLGQRVRKRTWRAEVIALAERRAAHARDLDLLRRVDALGEDHGVPPLGLGADGHDDPRDVLGRAVVEKVQVELDHVGVQDGGQRERARVGADVVEGDPPAALAQLGQRAQDGLGAFDERLLADVHQQRQGRVRERHVALQARRVRVEEEAEGRAQAGLLGEGDRGVARGVVESGHGVLPAGRLEQRPRRMELPVLGPAAHQRLVADDPAIAQIHDRLEDGA